jgi:hypothetical protein
MVRIAISAEAFEAIAKTLPLGSVDYENATNEKGERTVWLEEVWVDRLGAAPARFRRIASEQTQSERRPRVPNGLTLDVTRLSPETAAPQSLPTFSAMNQLAPLTFL